MFQEDFIEFTGASEQPAQLYLKDHSFLESALLSFYHSEISNHLPEYQDLPFSLKDPSQNDIPLQGINLVARVTDFLADVEVHFKYRNPGSQALEVVFTYIERGCLSSVYHFEVEKSDGTIIQSVCQEASQAVSTYEDAVASSRTAYLFEQNKDGTGFKLSIGNFLGESELIIRLKLTQPLSTLNDCLYFSIPFSQTPVLRSPTVESSKEVNGQGLKPTILNGLKLDVYFRLSDQIVSVKSEYKQHHLRIFQNTNNGDGEAGHEAFDARVTYFTKHSSKQIGILIKTKNQELPHLLIEEDPKFPEHSHHQPQQGNSSNEGETEFSKYIGMLSWMPSTEDIENMMRENEEEQEKEEDEKEQLTEIIFIVDRSGSMDGNRIECVKKALKLFLSSIPFGSPFNIIGFGTEFQSLFTEKSRRYDDESLAIAREHVSKMDANLGGTNVLEPIQFVLGQKQSEQSFPTKIFLLTDGEVYNVEQVVEFVTQHCGETQIFTFGVGDDVSPALVNGVAKASHGNAEFLVDNDSVIERSVVQQLNRALRPIIHNIEFINLESLFNNILKQQQQRHQIQQVDGSTGFSYKVMQIPKKYSSLYSGELMIVYFALKPSNELVEEKQETEEKEDGWTASLKCKINGKTKMVAIRWNSEDDQKRNGSKCLLSTNPTQIVHRNAAALLVREVEKELEGSSDDVSKQKHEMIRLSKRYSLVTKHTSLVAVDKSSTEAIQNTPELVQISNEKEYEMRTANVFLCQKDQNLDILMERCVVLSDTAVAYHKSEPSPISSFLSAVDSSLSSVGDYFSSLFTSPPPPPVGASTDSFTTTSAYIPDLQLEMPQEQEESEMLKEPEPEMLKEQEPEMLKEQEPEMSKEQERPTQSTWSVPQLVDQLAQTQRADGSWAYSPSISQLIAYQVPQLDHTNIAQVFPRESITRANQGSGLDAVAEQIWLDLWTTILVIVLLETKCSELEEKWILVARKAEKWISSQISKQFHRQPKPFVETLKSSLVDEAKKLIN